MPVGKLQEKKYEHFLFASLKSLKKGVHPDPDPLVRGTYGSADLDPDPHQNVNTGCKD